MEGAEQLAATGVARSLRRLWSAEGASLAAGVAQGLVIARELGPADYGVYALLTTFASFVFIATDPRSADAVVRYVAEFQKNHDVMASRAAVRGGFLLDLSWGLGALVLVTVLAVPAALVLNVEEHAWLIPVAALGLAVVAPAATSRAVLSVFDRFDLISSRQFAVAMVRAISVCAVALGGLGLTGVIWTLTFASLVESGFFVHAAATVTREKLGGLRGGSLRMFRHRAREMIGFVGYSGLTTLAASSVKQLDTLILGALTSTQEAGYYRLAKSLTAPAGSVGVPVQTVLYPRLALAQAGDDPSQVDRAVRRTFIRGELPLAGLALVCIPLVPIVVQVVAGKSFAGAVMPSVALVVGVAVSFATLHQRPVFLVRSLLRPLLWFTAASAVVSLALFVPAAEMLGASGVAWTRTAVLASVAAAMGVFMRARRPKPAASVGS